MLWIESLTDAVTERRYFSNIQTIKSYKWMKHIDVSCGETTPINGIDWIKDDSLWNTWRIPQSQQLTMGISFDWLFSRWCGLQTFKKVIIQIIVFVFIFWSIKIVLFIWDFISEITSFLKIMAILDFTVRSW